MTSNEKIKEFGCNKFYRNEKDILICKSCGSKCIYTNFYTISRKCLKCSAISVIIDYDYYRKLNNEAKKPNKHNSLSPLY